MIKDMVPRLIEEYINEHKDKLLFNIQTMINGRCIGSEDIVRDIEKALVEHLSI